MYIADSRSDVLVAHASVKVILRTSATYKHVMIHTHTHTDASLPTTTDTGVHRYTSGIYTKYTPVLATYLAATRMALAMASTNASAPCSRMPRLFLIWPAPLPLPLPLLVLLVLFCVRRLLLLVGVLVAVER